MIAKMAAMCKAKGEEWLTDLIGSQGEDSSSRSLDCKTGYCQRKPA